MIRRLLIAAFVVLAATPVWGAEPEPLELSDGTKYDPTKLYTIPEAAETGRLAWVPVAGFEYRARPGPDAPPRKGGRESRFMENAVVWQVAEVAGVKYLLLTTVIDGTPPYTAELPYGWVPASSVLSFRGRIAPTALPAELKDESGQVVKSEAVPQKGMIINTTDSLKKFLKTPSPPLFTTPAAGLAASLDKGDFPPALRSLYQSAGVRLGENVRVSPRLDGKGWVVTEGEKLNKGQMFAARQEYDLRLQNGDIIGREHPNMAWVYDRPQIAPGNRRKSFVLANVFFIFQRLNGFALIGSQQTIESQGVEAVHGWVEESRLSFWNTAEALEWDRSTTDPQRTPSRKAEGLIFTNSKDAEEWMTLHRKAERTGDKSAEEEAAKLAKKSFLAREPKSPDGRTRPYIGMEMRFPLLESLRQHPGGGTRMYSLGWFGPFVPEGQEEEKGERAQDRQLAERRKKLAAAIKGIKTVELLFIVDGTPSMYRRRTTVVPEVVAECLRELDRVRQSDDLFADLRVTVRVVLFGQRTNAPIYKTFPPPESQGPRSGLPAEIVSANVSGVDRRIAGLATWLREETMLPSEGPSGLEPVFDATREGLRLAQFGERSRKYVIVIGDAGDPSNTVNPKQEPLAGIIKQFAPPDAVPVTFWGIRVVEKGGAEAANNLLMRQFEAIRDESLRLQNDPEFAPGVFNLEGDAGALHKDLADTLRNRFSRLRTELAQIDIQLRELSLGVSTAAPSSPFLRKVLEANGIDINELAAGGVQVYETGYGYNRTQAGKDLVQQLRPVYLMPLPSVRKLKDVLLEITEEGRTVAKDPANLKNFMIELMKRLINTEDSKDVIGKTVAAEFRRKYGIAIKSTFLNTPVDQIVDNITDEDCERLLLIANRLKELLSDETESEWKMVSDRLPSGVRVRIAKRTEGSEKKADRFYEFPGGDRTKWVWLDWGLHVP